MEPTRVEGRHRVGDPIIFRADKDAPEIIVRPCSGKHRSYFLLGYIVLSCTKCSDTFVRVDGEPVRRG